MRKTYFILILIAGSVILTGCATKNPAATTNTAASPSTDTADVSAKTSQTAAAQTSNVPQIDVQSIDSTYQSNYTQALASVNTFLQNQAKLCSVAIEFPQAAVQLADQYFYFDSTGTQIKDWYGVAQVDPLQKVVRRMLVARKDVTSDIKCTTVTTPPSFASAYQTFVQNFPQIATAANAGKTRMTLMDNVWNATTWDTSGGVIATYQIPTASTQVQPAQTQTLSPTTGTY